MDKETSCLSCHGTGTILSPCDPRPGMAHAYEIVCGCGVFIARFEELGVHGYQAGQTLPWKHHKQALARAAGFVAWVDEPLVADIEALWKAGIATSSSCQGGAGGYPARFVMVDGAKAEAARALLPWAVQVREGTGRGNKATLYGPELPVNDD